MSVLTLTENALHKANIKYHGKFGHTLGIIKYIALMSRFYICYATCRLANQTVAPNLPGFEGINFCVLYPDIH